MKTKHQTDITINKGGKHVSLIPANLKAKKETAMNTYEITIKAQITKTCTVEAENMDAAEEQAHEIFSCSYADVPEKYNQVVVVGIVELS